MRLITSFTAIFLFAISTIVSAQGLGSASGTIKDDGRLAASTKQLNQFFRRFNAEESVDGNTRYNPGDSLYRNPDLRRGFFQVIFDKETSTIPDDLKNQFLDQVMSKTYPQYIRFHQEGWFSEVQADFFFKGKRERASIIFKLQPQGLGYEWIIDAVSFPPFKNLFNKPQGDEKDFLHPLSHELGFMNLRRAFEDSDLPESFTRSSFEPDFLTLFLYEMKQNNIRFVTVTDVKFHFFQIEGWYFEVSQFNRPGFNTGWLISSLVKLNPGDKESIQQYIYDQK